MRLFIGIGLPLSIAETLARSGRALIRQNSDAKIRWTPPENMHVTLSFLGQVHEARLDVVQQALATVHAVRPRIELNGVGVFDRAGVLFAEVTRTPSLLALAEQVFAATEACGFAREDRPYSPHVTLARTRDRIRLQSPATGDPAFHQSFETAEFRLYQSLTLPGGAKYDVLRSFPLE
jgi:RNA 2',3'-cyclic 3'-phosphodiesterase